MKVPIIVSLLMAAFSFACGFAIAKSFQSQSSVEEAPAIVWRASNGVVLATGTPSKGKSYFFDNLESVTFTAPQFKSHGVVITTKP